MRTDILEFHEFYASPLGEAAAAAIGARLAEAWGTAERCRLVGFGFANPYLSAFPDAERRLAFAPGGQGVIRWPADGANGAALVGERSWPLPDASIDRALVVHGLEESPDPRRLMREIWRVLADDGRAIIVCAHRRGLWATVDSTPFAAGRPYLKGRLEALLTETMFRPIAWSGALFMPPTRAGFVLRGASAWEKAGAKAWPGFAGALLVEAAKDMMAPAGLVRSAHAGLGAPARPVIAGARPASRGAASRRRAPARSKRREPFARGPSERL